MSINNLSVFAKMELEEFLDFLALKGGETYRQNIFYDVWIEIYKFKCDDGFSVSILTNNSVDIGKQFSHISEVIEYIDSFDFN